MKNVFFPIYTQTYRDKLQEITGMKKTNKASSDKETLQIENDFLKMKMMLEHGAQFGTISEVPPEVENEFLRSVSEFETQYRHAGRTKVIDKLGRPGHFKPVNKIPDDKIIEEWIALHDYMHERGIELSVCSPNISARELYRFATEELFERETDNISIPGMMTCFLYDEFYPDHNYDNQRIAVEECVKYFFEKGEFSDYYYEKKIQFNERKNLSTGNLSEIAVAFKIIYEEPDNVYIEANTCNINGKHCQVTGFYKIKYPKIATTNEKLGNWLVELQFDKKLGCWKIFNARIDGIDL